jgi:hypothetical protein
MSGDLPTPLLIISAMILGGLGVLVLIAALVALVRVRPMSFAFRALIGLLLLSFGSIAGMIGLGIQGYRALTREDVVGRLNVRPTAPQRFSVLFRYPDGHELVLDVAGDEVYVDAHILKWKPIANLIGLHTAYELDRLAGRYQDIKQERVAERTVHSLHQERQIDLFRMRQRYQFLSALFDAEYGSATFVPVTQPADLELRLSTTGLLMREAKQQP